MILRRTRPADVLAIVALFGLAGCNGLYFGDDPGRDVRKETGPLTVPPAEVRAGTAK
jgi:predicted small lipoprotein YifL